MYEKLCKKNGILILARLDGFVLYTITWPNKTKCHIHKASMSDKKTFRYDTYDMYDGL